MAATPLSAAATAPVEAVAQTSAAVLSTEEWVHSLHYAYFNLLAPEHVQYLTLEQVASIPHEAYLARMSDAARAALNAPQVQAINTSVVRIYPLTAQQIGWLTPIQIQQLGWADFHLLSAAQVPALTPSQVAAIPGANEFAAWTEAARAALTMPQVQALNVQTVFLYNLTPLQTSWLTAAQIRTLHHHDFRFLTAQQIPYLTPNQVSTISHEYYLSLISAEARAALTPLQVQAIDTAAVRIFPLTAEQIGWLTGAQIQQLGWADFHLIHPTRTVVLTPAQIASIPGADQFAMWSDAARAGLKASQIQALNVQTVFLYLLTPQQTGWLSVAQIQSLGHHDFRFLNAQQIPYLTPAQVATTSHAYYLSLIPAEARAALTAAQVQALNTGVVAISPLTAQQIGWLTPAQIQKLTNQDLQYVQPLQVPYLTIAQMAAVASPNEVLVMSDEAQAALSRAQLLALAPDVYAGVTRSHLAPPVNYHPAIHNMPGPDGLPMHGVGEAQRVFDLVPHAAATHVVVRSGAWSDASIWSNGQVPSAGAKVLIPVGVAVDFDVEMNTAIKTLRIDGFLRFAANRNTQLKADTIVVDTKGILHIGTAENPIQNHVTARILIADMGAIDKTWDPNVLSRGLISRGTVRMQGAYVTPYVALASHAMAGDTTLTLESAPVNWKVGDELAIAGVHPYLSDYGTERMQILAINGRTITVDRLLYDHSSPAGFDFSIHVANLTRNVQLAAEDDSVIAERPHLMFMHNPNVDVANIGVYGFGRTDKSVRINDPVVVNGVLQPGTGLNARARYAVHFHHTGVNPAYAPAVIRGSVVAGSPGWGYVNHSSNVTMEDNIAIDVNGSSFVTEDGNEIGTMTRNLSINATGSDHPRMARMAIHDFGFRGHGFWLQGPGVKLTDNIAAGSKDSAYFYMTSSSKNKFDAVNLANPAHAAGLDAIPVNAAPLAGFEGNVAYGSKIGLEIWDHLAGMSDARSYIDGFTAWNLRYAGIDLHYSGNLTIRDATLLGYSNLDTGFGITTNWATHDVAFENVRSERFEVGIDLPVRGEAIVNGGYISAVRGLLIEKGQTTTRSVTIGGQITLAKPTAELLASRPYYEVFLSGAINWEEFPPGYYAAFTPDKIYVARQGERPAYLYYFEQLPGFVPFPVGASTDHVPPQYVGKSNSQLWETYGVAFNGGIFPAGIPARVGYHAFSRAVVASGDFDSDGLVGPIDLNIWQQSFGVSQAADGDGDGDSDGADFLSWQRNIGDSAGGN